MNRRGPKLGADQLEAQVIALESRLLEYKSQLLSLESFVKSSNPVKFQLSIRYAAVDLAWRNWLLSKPFVLPVPEPAAQDPAPSSLPAKRRPGRPTHLSRLMEDEKKIGEEINRRCEEIMKEKGCDWTTARRILNERINQAVPGA